MALRIFPGDRFLLGAVVVFILFLIASPLILSEEMFQRVYAEGGVVETISFAGWLVGAVLIFVRVRPIGYRAISFAILSLALAAREADWQKKFTSEGVLKINYYENAAYPLMERVIAGVVVLILAAGLVYAFYAGIRFLFFEDGWHARSSVWLFITGLCLVLGKSLDRLPAELNNLFGITVGEGWVIHFQALEEGLEAVAPIVFCWSVWLSGIGRSYLARKEKQVSQEL